MLLLLLLVFVISYNQTFFVFRFPYNQNDFFILLYDSFIPMISIFPGSLSDYNSFLRFSVSPSFRKFPVLIQRLLLLLLIRPISFGRSSVLFPFRWFLRLPLQFEVLFSASSSASIRSTICLFAHFLPLLVFDFVKPILLLLVCDSVEPILLRLQDSVHPKRFLHYLSYKTRILLLLVFGFVKPIPLCLLVFGFVRPKRFLLHYRIRFR